MKFLSFRNTEYGSQGIFHTVNRIIGIAPEHTDESTLCPEHLLRLPLFPAPQSYNPLDTLYALTEAGLYEVLAEYYTIVADGEHLSRKSHCRVYTYYSFDGTNTLSELSAADVLTVASTTPYPRFVRHIKP